MKILITGGSGFIGKKLSEKLKEKGYEVVHLSRTENLSQQFPAYYWNYKTLEINVKALENVKGIIHLAGATVAKRWTKSYQKEIIKSRTKSADFLLEKCKELNIKLDFFISASGTNFYGLDYEKIPKKETDTFGNDFLAQVCVAWENAAQKFEEVSQRVVILRTSAVLDKNFGALAQLLKIVRYNLASSLGNAKQFFPWISLEDIVNLYVFSVENQNITRIYNASHPDNLLQKSVMQILAKKMKKIYIPIAVPSIFLRLILGKQADIILYGNAISAEKIQQNGFQFSVQSFEEFADKLY